MAQVFHPIANVVSKASILGGAAGLVGLLWLWNALLRSPYVTRAGVVLDQPVPFSHEHHATVDGIDCRYCHATVEDGPFAGMPTSQTCMSCHSQIHVDSPMLEPVRASFRSGIPLAWERVHDLPDFVYFDHSIHVRQGIACETCHGPVDRMPLTWKHEPLHMDWCLTCHREPERFVRPRNEVFTFGWRPPEDQSVIGARLVREHGIQAANDRLANCSICHR